MPAASYPAGYSLTFTGTASRYRWRRWWSGKCWRRARLLRGAGPGGRRIERNCMPDDVRGPTLECEDECDLRGVNRSTAMQDPAEGAAPPLSDRCAGRVVLAGPRSILAVADNSRSKGVGHGNAGSPACCDRCKNLNRQSKQDYGQKRLQPPAHHNTHHSSLTTCRVGSPDRVPAGASLAAWNVSKCCSDATRTPRAKPSSSRVKHATINLRV